jgi:hypothetical protein
VETKSLAALSILPHFNSHFRILRECFPRPDQDTPALVIYKREIMLSYRLLFGQNGKSRQLFRKSESKRVTPFKDQYDPLLDVLCGTRIGDAVNALPEGVWPDSCLDQNGKLLEQDVYSTSLDFPILGSRLLRLQEFDRRQQPSRVRDLWRDRRDPLQWYAFWAVLIFGGLTIVLSLLQLIVTCFQFRWQA